MRCLHTLLQLLSWQVCCLLLHGIHVGTYHAQNDVGRDVRSTPGKPCADLNHCTFSSTSETSAIGTCGSEAVAHLGMLVLIYCCLQQQNG
jgi:hypothetical protein